MMLPVALTTSRILLLGLSAKNTSPAESTARPRGLSISAAVASPPSPLKPAVPSPAMVIDVAGRRDDLADSVVVLVGDEQVARGVDGDGVGAIQLGGGREPAVAAVAGCAVAGHGDDVAGRLDDLADHVVVAVDDEQVARGIDGEAPGTIQLGGGRRAVVARVTGCAIADRGHDRARGARGEVGGAAVEAETVIVPAARLEVVNVATPLTSVSLSSVPLWSLNVTVPPFGVAPPADKSLTVAVNVTDCPGSADAVEAISAVSVGKALNRARWSKRPS